MSVSSTNRAVSTYACAYDHPATQRAIRVRLLLHSAGALGLLALGVACLVALHNLPDATVSWGFLFLWILSLVLFSLCARAVAQAIAAHGEQKVLRTYPWQRLHGAVYVDAAGQHKLVLPNPDAPYLDVHLLASARLFPSREDGPPPPGSMVPDEVWFAGDPRFITVVALPGPRRMRTVIQPSALESRIAAYDGPISEEARRRALAVGARVAPPEGALARGPVRVGGVPKVAMHHPETAAGWRRSMLRRSAALYGQIAALAIFYTGISLVKDPGPLLPAAVTLMVIAPFTLSFAALAVGGARRLGRTLRAYPWQECIGEPENGQSVVILRPAKGLEFRIRSLPLRTHFKNADRFWFAGDMRYGGALTEVGGSRPTRVVNVDPKKAHERLRATPQLNALAEESGLTKDGRPRTWAY
ncbi:hypothetical protein [Streptomyces sp. KR80]|uniref:hypothetical protein n=1 Tax=Streptomyces sp. KR80 TaxID=3457426 RepID=UPI003FD568A7